MGAHSWEPRECHRSLGTWVANPFLGSRGVEPSPGVSVPICRECREPGAVCLPWIVERLLEGNSLTFLLLCVSLPGSPWDWDTLWMPLPRGLPPPCPTPGTLSLAAAQGHQLHSSPSHGTACAGDPPWPLPRARCPPRHLQRGDPGSSGTG